jgi:hypothetical protein
MKKYKILNLNMNYCISVLFTRLSIKLKLRENFLWTFKLIIIWWNICKNSTIIFDLQLILKKKLTLNIILYLTQFKMNKKIYFYGGRRKHMYGWLLVRFIRNLVILIYFYFFMFLDTLYLLFSFLEISYRGNIVTL